MRVTIILPIIGLLAIVAMPASSQSIIVWDRDHDQMIADPEGAGYVDATYGITNALDDLGYAYDVTVELEPDLSGYDVLFLIMGTYC